MTCVGSLSICYDRVDCAASSNKDSLHQHICRLSYHVLLLPNFSSTIQNHPRQNNICLDIGGRVGRVPSFRGEEMKSCGLAATKRKVSFWNHKRAILISEVRTQTPSTFRYMISWSFEVLVNWTVFPKRGWKKNKTWNQEEKP